MNEYEYLGAEDSVGRFGLLKPGAVVALTVRESEDAAAQNRERRKLGKAAVWKQIGTEPRLKRIAGELVFDPGIEVGKAELDQMTREEVRAVAASMASQQSRFPHFRYRKDWMRRQIAKAITAAWALAKSENTLRAAPAWKRAGNA